MFRRSSPFRLVLVPSLVALLASPFLRHNVQAETAGTPLSRPAGYKPEKKTVRLWDSKCATCHGEDGRAHDHEAERYGDYLMELLINGLMKQGAHRDRLEAKLFGGARMMGGG